MNTKIKTLPFLQKDTLQHSTLKSETTIVKEIVNSSAITKGNYIEHSTIAKKIVIDSNPVKDSIGYCPSFLANIPNNKSLITSYKEDLWFKTNKDSCCYIVKKQDVISYKPIIILEKKGSTNYSEKGHSIKERNQNNSDWTFVPLLVGLFLLASIVTLYRKFLGQLFESVIYRFTSNKLFNDKNIHFQRLAIMLDVLFILSFSLVVDQIAKRFQIYTPPENIKYIIFLASCSFLLVLRFFRWTVFRLSALFSNHQSFFSELFNSSSLYTRILGVFLLPFVFLITYSTGFISTICIYISVFSIFIMLILRIVSMFKVFIVRGFSIFYFILYLCALEIAPLLVILKEVKSR